MRPRDVYSTARTGGVKHNPYTPPQASVADTPEVLPPRPRAVNLALIVLWSAFTITLANVLYRMDYAGGGLVAVASIVWNLTGLALAAWIYLKIARGRNWARFALLALLCLQTLSFAWTWYASYAQLPEGVRFVPDLMWFVFPMARFALYYTALYLLFVPGRQWFRRPP